MAAMAFVIMPAGPQGLPLTTHPEVVPRPVQRPRPTIGPGSSLALRVLPGALFACAALVRDVVARTARKTRLRRGRATNRSTTARLAVEAPVAPVKEPEVETPTTVLLPGIKEQEQTKNKKADQYKLLLFNDPLNKREYVARCLMTIPRLDENQAYDVMMKAHREGVAVVGIWNFETAEAYCEALKFKGLTVDIVPVDGDDE